MDIYALVLSQATNIHYAKRYVNYIAACVKKNQQNDDIGYTEKHHILPVNRYPEFKNFKQYPWNCAVLTYRQHILAHWLLWKVFDDHAHVKAFRMMCNMEDKIPSRANTYTYQRAREISQDRTEFEGYCVYQDSNGNSHWLRTDDPKVLSGEVKHHQTGMAYYRGDDGTTLWLPTDHEDVLSGKYPCIWKGVPKSEEGRNNIIEGIHRTGFPAKNAITGENLGRVPKSDPRWESGEIIALASGQACYKDSFGNNVRVSPDDPRVLSGELISINSGRMPVRDSEGNVLYVNVDDPLVLDGTLVPLATGFGVYQNKHGEIKQLSVDDPRVLSGEYYSIAKGKAAYFDSDGNTHYVFVDDPRVLDGTLVSVANNKSQYIDANGNRIYTTIDDPRVLSGELVGHTTGFAAYKNSNGDRVFLHKDDPRVISGEYVGINKGRVVPEDEKNRRKIAMIAAGRQAKLSCDGTPLGKIPLHDPRWSTGEIVSLRKNLSIQKKNRT